jgi:uncharacterized protein (TIGR00295 family)
MLTEKQARELLQTFKLPQPVINHVELVNETCLNLVDLLKERKPHMKINRRLVSVGALLHDLGRSKTNAINHGLAGAQIIRDLNLKNDLEMEKVAKICERHLGGGIGMKEAIKLGLPANDYIPKSIEEKIVTYCDNLIDDDVVKDPSWAAVDYEKKHGKNSEPARRVRELNKFFEDLLEN